MVLPTSALLQRAQTPLIHKTRIRPITSARVTLKPKLGFPGMSEGVSYACLAIYWTARNCLAYSLWRTLVHVLCLYGTFSSKVTNAPEQQRASVTEKTTGALRQGWTDATLDDILTYVILLLWSSRVSATLVDLALWLCVHKLTILFPLCPRHRGSPSPASLSPPLSFWYWNLSLSSRSPLGHPCFHPRSLQAELKRRCETRPPPWALWTRHSPFHLPPCLPVRSGSSSRFHPSFSLYFTTHGNYCWLIIAVTIYLW